MASSHLISQKEAVDLVGDENTSFVDGSWYLPVHNRDGKEEFASRRIPGAVFFNIDAIADQSTGLPHMLLAPEAFARAAGELGLTTERTIIVYDGPGIFSAPRVWWTLKVMGAKNVSVLEGGMDQWAAAGLPVETGPPVTPPHRQFDTKFDPAVVAGQNEVVANIESADAQVLDARPADRFSGEAPEPRPGLRKGHIPGSLSLPFDQVIRDGTLKPAEELDQLFSDMGVDKDTPVITSCGSGVTAALLGLALTHSGRRNFRVYDGSWAEWGLPDGPEVETS